MGEMKFLEKLLDGVGVEWKALKDIGIYVRGLVYNKSSESSDGQGYKVLRANNITLSENSLNFDDVKIVNFDTKVKKDQKLRCNDILISAASGSREHVGKVAFIEADIDYYFGGFMGVIRCSTSMIPRYAFHILTSQHFKIYLDEMLNSSTINNLNSAVMGDFKFPIPCPDNPQKSLEIQAEIVRILDAMTAHTAELTAELTARKKQYNYYRDKLLSFEDGEVEVEWKKLGDILKTIKTGKLNANAMVDNGRYPFFTCDSKPFKIDTYAFDTEAIIVSGNGSQVGHINYYKGKFNAYQRTYILADCIKEMKIEFLLIYLKAYLRAYIMRHSKKGSVPYITMPMLENFLAPVPSIEKQIQIFSALSKFEILTESMIQGLPKEIELREKQYSYYRELLLNFKNPKEQPLWN